MGIYIKGMEMPTSCDFCPLVEQAYTTCCIITANKVDLTKDSRPSDCPLTEIPPHGPLIDMDDFLQEWSELESYRTAMALCEVIEAEPPESCGDCNHYCTGQFFNNEEICMVTGDNAPYDISDCPLRKKEEGRE